MSQVNNILQELTGLGSKLVHQPINPYELPQGYFEGFASSVLARIRATGAQEELEHISPYLAKLSPKTIYTVPAGYFESLAENILHVVTNREQTPAEELAGLSPFLGSLKKQVPYAVPESYFEQMAKEPVARLAPKKVAKIVSFGAKKMMRYAAAAVVTGVILVAGFFALKSDRIDPVEEPTKWIAKNVEKKVDKTDLDSFLKLANPETTIATAAKPAEVKELMRDVSDQDIQEFLNDLPEQEGLEDDEILLN